MTTIPDRERGYSVEADTLIVHERYQDHAPRAMRTSALGVTNVALQRGMEPVPCEVCFPPPLVVRSSRRKVEGGDIRPAEPYIVGERGPETFRPLADGKVETVTPEPTETVTVSTED
jgi:hypothetical protein